MSGKGAKGLLTGKTPASKDKDKDKKRPISRSSRAGLQGDALVARELLVDSISLKCVKMTVQCSAEHLIKSWLSESQQH